MSGRKRLARPSSEEEESTSGRSTESPAPPPRRRRVVSAVPTLERYGMNAPETPHAKSFVQLAVYNPTTQRGMFPFYVNLTDKVQLEEIRKILCESFEIVEERVNVNNAPIRLGIYVNVPIDLPSKSKSKSKDKGKRPATPIPSSSDNDASSPPTPREDDRVRVRRGGSHVMVFEHKHRMKWLTAAHDKAMSLLYPLLSPLSEETDRSSWDFDDCEFFHPEQISARFTTMTVFVRFLTVFIPPTILKNLVDAIRASEKFKEHGGDSTFPYIDSFKFGHPSLPCGTNQAFVHWRTGNLSSINSVVSLFHRAIPKTTVAISHKLSRLAEIHLEVKLRAELAKRFSWVRPWSAQDEDHPLPALDFNSDDYFTEEIAQELVKHFDPTATTSLLVDTMNQYFAHVCKSPAVVYMKCMNSLGGTPGFQELSILSIKQGLIFPHWKVKWQEWDAFKKPCSREGTILQYWLTHPKHAVYADEVNEPGKPTVLTEDSPQGRLFRLNTALVPAYHYHVQAFSASVIDTDIARGPRPGQLYPKSPEDIKAHEAKFPLIRKNQEEYKEWIQQPGVGAMYNGKWVTSHTFRPSRRVVLEYFFTLEHLDTDVLHPEMFPEWYIDPKTKQKASPEESWRLFAREGPSVHLRAILHHFYWNLCDGEEYIFWYLMSYLARLVFTPHVKIHHIPVIIGRMGAGKSSVFVSFAYWMFSLGSSSGVCHPPRHRTHDTNTLHINSRFLFAPWETCTGCISCQTDIASTG